MLLREWNPVPAEAPATLVDSVVNWRALIKSLKGFWNRPLRTPAARGFIDMAECRLKRRRIQ